MRRACRLAMMLLALLLSASWLSAGISVTNVVLTPSTLHPGMSGVASMTVTNSDATDQVYAVSMRGMSKEGPVQASGEILLGDFRSGMSSTVNFPFSIPNTTRAGIYTMLLQFAWTNASSSSTKPVMIPVTVTDPALFSASSKNGTVYTTGDFILPVELVNRGGSASQVRLSINSTSFFQTGDNPLWVGDVGGEAVPLSLGVSLSPSTSSGAYSLPIVLTYRDESGQDASSTVYLRLNVKRKSPQFSVSILNLGGFYPGRTVPLQLNIENSGDDAAYGVRVRLGNTSALTSLASSDVSLDDLLPGQSKVITIETGVNDVAPGFYSPALLVHYRNSNGEEQALMSVPMGLSVETLSDVSVFVTAKPTPVVGGEVHTLSVTVSNTGTSALKALTIQMQPSPAFRLQEAQDQQFIGGLNQDDFSSVQFKVQVADVQDGLYPVNVSLSFKDSYNRVHSSNQTVNIKVMSKETAARAGGGSPSPLGLALAAVVVLGLAGLAWWFFLRRKKPAEGARR
ncbi:MAG: hypothetical protein M1530_00860 [Candidatus Marsarchaeota archaeon]|nr:hypothetical protein [Candidatus Marsarchaeota archaeon]